MIAWLRGWATTLHIMIFERETYRLLRDYSEFDEDDFVEAPRPRVVEGDATAAAMAHLIAGYRIDGAVYDPANVEIIYRDV